MAFLDEISKKISQTSQDVVQKTKDTAESLRLSNAVSDEEKRVQSLYQEIGKRYFELYADSCAEEFATLVQDIKNAHTTIANYNDQIKRIKGIVSCPNCGSDVDRNAPFCSNCGTRIVPETPVASALRCVNCGKELAEGMAFCTNCGTKAEAPAPAPVAAPKLCANCGKELAEGMAFCTNCGTKIETAAPAPVVAPAPKVCPNCNCPVGDGMAFCTNCGTKV